MSKVAALGRFIGTWYVSTVLLIAAGLAIGSTVFFYGYPGKPKIGVIDIPFTVINDRSAFEISAMLDYVRNEGSIKGVVISINSPGGGAAPSEKLFFEIVRLREKKPVVIVMEDLVASGGFMMSMAANYSIAKPSSFVGGVGVILSPLPPLLPFQPPDDSEAVTGPFKLVGGSRRHYITMTDQLRQAFAAIVLTERGDRLRITKNEILEGNLYSGVEAMQVGLIDGLGGHTDAIDKVAS
jgi:protease-4